MVNSSSPASETLAGKRTAILNSTTTATETGRRPGHPRDDPRHSQGTTDAVSSTAYTTTWTPQTIQSQIHSFLTNYISANTGVPAADIEITGMLVSNIAVWTQFSTRPRARSTTTSRVPSPGSSSRTTSHWSTGPREPSRRSRHRRVHGPLHGSGLAGQTNDFGGVFDPVDHQWYASAEAAGYPDRLGGRRSGAIFVPGQAAFLGWAANGEPEFGVGGCFIVCFGSALTGAASAVSSLVGSAASTVSNAVGGVTNTVSNSVIDPVSGTLGSDLSGVSTSVSRPSTR